jgi:hypothetical protein
MNVTQKLIKVQNELKAPKGNYNSFGKYKYRSAEDILEAVKPLNADNGLLLTLSDKPTLIGEWHYIEATATITDGETSLSVTAYARESLNKKGMDESQITGTASSYARKYALNGLYLIDDTKDADTDEYQQQTNQEQASKKASDKQLDLITKLLKGDNDRLNKMLEYYKVKDLTQLSAAQASATIKKLQGQS